MSGPSEQIVISAASLSHPEDWVIAGKEAEVTEVRDAIGLLERSYEELTSLEADVEDPVFQEFSKTAAEMTSQVWDVLNCFAF